MENVKILDLKKALFYYLFSWRTILLCIAVCVALAVGAAYIRPVPEVGQISEKEEIELEENRAKFITEDEMAKGWAAEIAALEKELFALEDQLASSLFLQIDPDQRMNKNFTLQFSHFSTTFQDEAEKIRMNQMLCLQYMRPLSSDRYLNYLGTKGILKYDPSDLANLVDMRVELDGSIAFSVTAPEEIVIDQIIKLTKDFLEKVIRPEIDLLAIHYLEFSDVSQEVVQDPSIHLYKERIEDDIQFRVGKIDELNQMIDTALEESLKDEGIDMLDDASIQAPSKPPLKMNIALGFLLGIVISVFVTAIRYRRLIMRIDVSAMARANNISHFGVVSYLSKSAKERSKWFGGLVDRFIIKLFGMAYDPDDTVNQTAYTARFLRGLVDARKDEGDSQLSFNILVPNVQGDKIAGVIVSYISKFLDQEGVGRQVRLIEGGSLEHDPDTIDIARDCSGLLLLLRPSDKITSLYDSIQRSFDLSKEILGVLELDERW